MNNEIEIVIDQIQKLYEQLENDYNELHVFLQGDIYQSYVEVVQDEMILLENVQKNLINYQKNKI